MTRHPFAVITAALLLLVCSLANAQITAQTGAVTGTVTDPTGASIPNAKVLLTSEKGIVQEKATSEAGTFTFPLLEPGLYKITVEARGFSKAAVNGVRVQITETTNLPVRLEVGTETIEISVAAEAVAINTSAATLGNTLPGSVIDQMPLATRNFTNLLALNAGTSSDLPNAAAAGRASSTVFVNGQRGTGNNLVINGVDANNIASNNFGNVAIPAPDTLEEFRVQTSLYDASQGKTSGGNINAITKGGGPEYHGQLYEFFRNEKLNANDFFFNKNGSARPILRQNQFGGNFGGPVPFLNKKTYFFGSYQGTRQLNGLSGAITGQFPVMPAQRTAANLAQAFGVDPSRIDATAVRLLNAPGQYGGFLIPSGVGAAGTFGLITLSAPLRFNDDQFNANGDHNLSDTHRLSLRYFRAKGKTSDPFGGQGAGGLGSGQDTPIGNHLASISSTWALRPNLVNELRLGFNRITQQVLAEEPVKLADIGMSRFNSSLYPGIPLLFTNDIGPVFGGISTNNDQASAVNTVHFSEVLAWTKGTHTVRAGFELRQYQINTYNNFASRGFLAFDRWTDFLTGNILQAFAGTGQTYRDFRARDVSWFLQDDWKMTRRLTWNLGIRYDYLGPSWDKRHRVGNYDPNLLSADTMARGGAGLLAGFILPEAANFGTIRGTPGVDPSTLTERNRRNFSPRVGFAYDVFGNGKTAVRGGYGLYYVRTSNQTLLQLLTAAPFFQLSSIVAPGTSLNNPFPALPMPSDFPIFPRLPELTGFNAAGTPTFSAALLSLNPIQRNLRTPYAQHYNFSIQHQISGKSTLELGYIGSAGVRLLHSLQVNQARLASAAEPIRGLTASSIRNVNARVWVPGFSSAGLNMVTDNGHSTYNAMVVTFNHRASDLFVQTAYTLAKSIDNNSGSATQDLGNAGGNQLVPWLQRGLSAFDRTHRLQITYRYDVPGIADSGRFLKHLTKGWSVGGLTTFQSAVPIQFICTGCGTNNVYGFTTTLYPNVTGDFKNIIKGGDPRNFLDAGSSWFNSGILTPTPNLPAGTVIGNVDSRGGPGNGQFPVGGPGTGPHNAQLFGTLPRTPGARGPFQQQFDFFLSRSFPMWEGVRIDFRAEFFNLFNHQVFTIPAGASTLSAGSPGFGRFAATATQPRIVQFAAKLYF